MHNQSHEAAGLREKGMSVPSRAAAVAVSALSTRVYTRESSAIEPPTENFNRDDSREVIRLKQPETLDATEMLFIGLCSELKPINV